MFKECAWKKIIMLFFTEASGFLNKECAWKKIIMLFLPKRAGF